MDQNIDGLQKNDHSPRSNPNLFLDIAWHCRVNRAYLAVWKEGHAGASDIRAREIINNQKGIVGFGETGDLGENSPIAHRNAEEDAQSRQ